MTVASGTATDYLDLLDKFDAFVTAALPSGQDWTQLKDSVEGPNDRNLYYQAPGLTGTDEIFMNLFAYKDVGDDYYNIGLRGATGFNGGAPWDNQPNQSPAAYMLLWNTAIPYWFIGSGRCAKIIAKIGGVWQQFYMGFITPGASPSEWALPMFIGGMHSVATKRYSNTDPTHRAFWNPATSATPSAVPGSNSGAFLRSPGGEWIAFGNYTENLESALNTSGNQMWPYGTQFEQVGTLYSDAAAYGLQPIVLHSATQGRAIWGELDGIFFVSGFANAAEDIITISGTDYLVVPSAFRSSGPSASSEGANQYAAYKLV